MKLKFDIEASPQELRTFFGLPDLEPLQKEMIERVRKHMEEGITGYDPLAIMKPYLPDYLKASESLQRKFWEAMVSPATSYKVGSVDQAQDS